MPRSPTCLSRYGTQASVCWVQASTCKLAPPSTVPRLGGGQKNWGSGVQFRLIPKARMWFRLAACEVWAGWSDIVVILMGPWITRDRQAQTCQMCQSR